MLIPYKVKQFFKNIILKMAPWFIKQRVFAGYKTLSWKNISDSDHDAELLLLPFLADKNAIFFDVGANRGEYAFFAEKHFDKKNIFLFEPQNKLFKQLQSIFAESAVMQIAISDKTGKAQLKIPFINGVEDNCLSSLETGLKETNETDSIFFEIETDTLDNFVFHQNIIPNIIKIDVEGHELAVIKGAQKTIENHHPNLIIEIEQRHHSNFDVENIFQYFFKHGYECFYFSKKENQILPYHNKQSLTNTTNYFGTKYYINNYLFLHNSFKGIKNIDEINHFIKSQSIK
jgi:FkbM family methyltransferase